MNRHIVMGCISSIFVLVISNLSYAQGTYDISVTLNGTSIGQSCGGTTTRATCWDIGGQYMSNTVEITPISSASRARVEIVTSDNSTDTLRLINAKITSKSGTQSPTLIFKRRFIAGPAGSTVYKIHAGGLFSPEQNNALTVKGIYTNPPTGTPDQIGSNITHTVNCGSTGCTQTISTSRTETYNPPAASERVLQGELRLTLQQTNSSFSTSTGVKLEAPSQGEGETGPSVCPECTAKKDLGFFCQMTYSTGKAFDCPSCVTEDGQVAGHAKINLFASTNWDHLVQDMARGQGEHLASLAGLFHIPFAQQQQFYALAQETYFDRPDGGYLLPDEFLMSLQNKWRTKSTVALIK